MCIYKYTSAHKSIYTHTPEPPQQLDKMALHKSSHGGMGPGEPVDLIPFFLSDPESHYQGKFDKQHRLYRDGESVKLPV